MLSPSFEPDAERTARLKTEIPKKDDSQLPHPSSRSPRDLFRAGYPVPATPLPTQAGGRMILS